MNLGFLNFLNPAAVHPAGWLAILGVGLVASLSSCTAMVGGLVAGLSAEQALHGETQSFGRRLRPHLYFNVGRLLGYALGGAAIGAIGSALTIDPGLNGALIIVVACFMIALGANLLHLWPARLTPRMPQAVARWFYQKENIGHPLGVFGLGAATFFLPCGFTQAMQLFALSTGDAGRAALIMFVFALGTLPALLGIGLISAAAKGQALKVMAKAAGALIIVLGLLSLQNGLALVGWNFQLPKGEPPTAAQTQNGTQTIEMEVTPYGVYSPDTLTVKKDVPVQWRITGSEEMGCANTLVLRQFGVRTNLKPGLNIVRFTPNQTGRYTFSCSMGMVRGTMIVTP